MHAFLCLITLRVNNAKSKRIESSLVDTNCNDYHGIIGDRLEYSRISVHLVKQHSSSHIHSAFYSRVFDEAVAGYNNLRNKEIRGTGTVKSS